MRVIVCDAGPVIHLYESQCLPILGHTGDLYLPQRVHLEIQSVIHLDNQWPEWLKTVTLSHKEQIQADSWQNAGGLHAGEAEALVLARQKNADWFLTDDAATRLFISMLGIEVHGSLGVVLWSAAKRIITREETEGALKRLKQSSLWLSEKVYNEALEALDDIHKIVSR